MKETVLVVAALAIASCPGATVDRGYYVLSDISAGVTADGRTEAVTAIESVATDLQRGDSLTVIPIGADAEADAPGRILRFRLAKERQAYDEDRDLLLVDIAAGVSDLMVTASEKPASNTDLLGTFRLVAEELEGRTTEDGEAIVICLSDAIQDDSAFDFTSDSRLASVEEARLLARTIARGRPFENVNVFMGSVRSDDLRRLPRTRREAIRAFWTDWLELQGATVTWSSDGVGRLSDVLKTFRTT